MSGVALASWLTRGIFSAESRRGGCTTAFLYTQGGIPYQGLTVFSAPAQLPNLPPFQTRERVESQRTRNATEKLKESIVKSA